MKLLDTVWTTTNCEKLRNWWETEGRTAPEIVAELSELGYRVTRNAVIGKVYRMGLRASTGKAGASTEKRSAAMKAANVKRRERTAAFLLKQKKFNSKPPPEPPISATNPPKGNKAVLLKHSKEGQCKAIIGYINGRMEDAVYCGEKTPPRVYEGQRVPSSWCDYHKSIYLNEAKKR